MEAFGIPVKTQLGVDELRGRSRSLGQRHRTVLLLIDGRRSVGEVLNLAQQAGAQPSHFEDLLKLGMAELPPSEVSTPAPPPEPQPRSQPRAPAGAPSKFGSSFGSLAESETGPGFEPELESQSARHAFDVPIAPLEDEPNFPDVEMDPSPVAPAEKKAQIRQVPPANQPPARSAGVPSPSPAPVRPPVASRQPPLVAPAPSATASRHTPLPRTAGQSSGRAAAPPPNVPAAPLSIRDEVLGMAAPPKLGAPQPDRPEQEKFDRVRALLVETLRIDSPLFGARLLLRLRDAKAIDDLIDLVWIIERHLAGTRYARKEMVSLHQARELLGLGNTVVPDD